MDMEGLDTCNICQESFDENIRPRTLPCGHTLCTDCISNAIKDQTIDCPHCKFSHQALKASDFPINYSTEALISKLKKTNLGAGLECDSKSDTCLSDSKDESSNIQAIVADQKKSLKQMVEVTKRTQKDARHYQEFILKRKEEHKKLGSKIKAIVNLNESIFRELDVEDKKVARWMKERDRYQSEVCNNIAKLDDVTDNSIGLETSEELEKIYDALVGWNTKCSTKLLDVKTIQRSVKLVKEASDALSLISKDNTIAASKTTSLLGSDLSVIEKMNTLVKAVDVRSLQAASAFTKQILENRKLYAIQKRDGQVRSAEISFYNGKTYLHYLKKEEPPSDAQIIEYNSLLQTLRPGSVSVFLDLSWKESTKRKIHIHLAPDTPLARHFQALCSGELGPSYANTRFFEKVFEKCRYLTMSGGDYEKDDGRGGAPLFTGLEHNNEIYSRECPAGSVGSIESQHDGPKSSQFNIYLTSIGNRTGIFGQVQDGLDVLQAAVHLGDIKQVQIVDCGIVLPF